ncbi:hypothetical protein V1511DRAFT_485876 [Dipodascopsis uninucleata]
MAALALPRPTSPTPSGVLGSNRSPTGSTPSTPASSIQMEMLDPIDIAMPSFAVAAVDFDPAMHNKSNDNDADIQSSQNPMGSYTGSECQPRQQQFNLSSSMNMLELSSEQSKDYGEVQMLDSLTTGSLPNSLGKSPSVTSIMIASPCPSPQSPSRSPSPISLSPQFSSSPRLSLLHPPCNYRMICSSPPIYALTASQLVEAINYSSYQPLPPTTDLFPWCHGLHPRNEVQVSFLDPGRTQVNKVPTSFRGITLVKMGSFNSCKLRGTISHKEFLPDISSQLEGFLNLDPVSGVGLRNFHIQVAKVATLSDIVVYSKKGQPADGMLGLAKRISQAQIFHRSITPGIPEYNTFIVTDSFEVFEKDYPELVAITSNGTWYENSMDFLYHERKEMSSMSKACEVTPNFSMGNLADVTLGESEDSHHSNSTKGVSERWDIYVECLGGANIPSKQTLQRLGEDLVDKQPKWRSNLEYGISESTIVHIEFPASGSLAVGNLTDHNIEAIIDCVEWLYKLANEHNKRIIIFCQDGYTETSLLGLAYLMYATGVTAPQAYIDLHHKYGRAFFTFSADVVILNHMEKSILMKSPVHNPIKEGVVLPLPHWFVTMDGSLPSKIFPHMYLGNLGHASNPELLRELGIKRVLSVGEPLFWRPANEMITEGGVATTKTVYEGFTKLMYVQQVQDDGIDSLSRNIEECLEFIDEGYRLGEPTLVHCRVGVSRSATICIAEAMRRERMSLPRAYLYVRARRLNVIIQPNLRFMYELMKWEEEEALRRGATHHCRDMDWALLCKEISAMNKAYIG